MRKLVPLVLLFALVASVAWASPTSTTPLPARLVTGDEEVTIPANAPQFVPRPGELDELVGDTIVVGTTYWESQHNGTVGRMIGFAQDIDGESEVFLIYTDLADEANTNRHIMANRVNDAHSEDWAVEAGGPFQVDGADRAGYTTLGFEPVNGVPFPAYHRRVSASDDFSSGVASELSFAPMIFNDHQVPTRDDIPFAMIWPRATYTSYNGSEYVHMTMSESRDEPDDPQHITYARMLWDPAAESMTLDLPEDETTIITDEGMNISSDIAVSSDGSRVVVGQTMARYWTIDEGSEQWQWNNDIYLWMSEDGGETFDEPMNLTDFLPIDWSQDPDTMAMNQDTMRAYTDMCIYFDTDDDLHVAFSLRPYYAVQEQAFISYSYIYHWDETTNAFTMAVDANYIRITSEFAISQPAWHMNVNRPSLYQDPDTDILWMTYNQYLSHAEGDTTDIGTATDTNGRPMANADVYVTASPPDYTGYNGLRWAEGVNVTNTKWTGDEPAPPGECRSELDPNFALNNEGDYLNLIYSLDLDSGFHIQEEGVAANVPMVYHRVPKQDVLDSFDAWVTGVPMHIDETGHWEDPLSWEWNDDEGFFEMNPENVEEGSSVTPHSFELEQNYPNPFNPTTTIAFSLQHRADVKVAVFDVLGREIATIAQGAFNAGRHQLLFDGSELASGVYFYRVEAGDFQATRKMVLMK
ncbi:T9SS type A sorting domain-containing protein [bacterium]|nr:T9SS type A sorting domain-containing protein [bacterium]